MAKPIAPAVLPDDLQGLLPVDDNPAAFVKDPSGRPNHVLHMPSARRAPQEVTVPGTYEDPVGADPKKYSAAYEYPAGSGNFYIEGTGDVYHVHPTLFQFLTGEKSSFVNQTVPADPSITAALQARIAALEAQLAATQNQVGNAPQQ